MVAALWPGAVAPNSFTRLVHWLEAGPAWLHAWRVSAAHVGADLALRFVMSWYPTLSLNQLGAQRAGAEGQLAEQAGRITGRASYLASFTTHDEFQAERMKDGVELPPDNFGLALDDPVGSSTESGPYTDDEAGLDDIGISADPEAVAKESTQADDGTTPAAGAEEPASAQPGVATS